MVILTHLSPLATRQIKETNCPYLESHLLPPNLNKHLPHPPLAQALKSQLAWSVSNCHGKFGTKSQL